MKRQFFLTFFALFLCIGATPSQSHARELAKPDYIAVYFYADWCTSCQILSPKVQEARDNNTLDKENVLFVKMDLTDKPSIHQSILLAQAIGVGDFLKQQGSATGYVAVLDADTKEEQRRFNAGASLDDIEAYFQLLIAKD